jgi:hypothetical protein
LAFTNKIHFDGHLINLSNSYSLPHYLHGLHYFHVHFTIFPCTNTQPPLYSQWLTKSRKRFPLLSAVSTDISSIHPLLYTVY